MASASNLAIEIDNDRLIGGETLQGQLRAPSDQIDSVRLRGRWQRRVDGAVDERATAFEHDLSNDGGERFPFEFELPMGPYSFEGSAAAVAWELEAVGVSADGEDVASTTTAITLRPGNPKERASARDSALGDASQSWLGDLIENISSAFGHPTSDEELFERLDLVETGTGPYERKTSLMGNAGSILTLLAGGIAFLVVAPRVAGASDPVFNWIFRAIGIGLLGWGSWIVYKGIRNRMAEAALGDVGAAVQPANVVRGDTLTSFLAFAPDRDVEINEITATLKCIRVEKTKGRKYRHRHHHHDHDDFHDDFHDDGFEDGGFEDDEFDDDDDDLPRTHTYTDTLFSEEIEVLEPQTLEIDERCAVAEQFTVPETVNHSYYHSAPFWVRWLPLRGLTLSLEVKWVVEFHVDIEDWPDWVTQYKCVVYP